MALFSKTFEALGESTLGSGLIFGAGALLIAPLAIPVLREATKLAVRSGMTLYTYSSDMAAQIGVQAAELIAEAQSELRQDKLPAAKPKPSGEQPATPKEEPSRPRTPSRPHPMGDAA